MEKNKKKTLTISTNLKKKIDTSKIPSGSKKSYFVEKKKFSKPKDILNRSSENQTLQPKQDKTIKGEAYHVNL